MTLFKKTLLTAACVSTLLMAGSALAADSTTLDINGTVMATCKFSDKPYTMSFGNMDPSATAAATATTTINYRCSTGVFATALTIGGLTNTSSATLDMLDGTGILHLPTHLTWTTPTTRGTGFAPTSANIPVVISGTVAIADLRVAVAGPYSASFAVTLAP